MINITNEDNMELMSRYEDNHFDLAIVDPPYGIDAAKMTMGRGSRNDTGKNKKKNWDNDKPKKEYWSELFRVSKNQIVWGANYFTNFLPPSMGWIYWDKLKGINDFSDGELAFSSFDRALRHYNKRVIDKTVDRNRIHPTQKPVGLYEWILMNYSNDGDKILDTHLGSGSIAIACHNLGFDLTACELDKEYYEAAIKRLNEHQSQLRII
jgi:site-specific DNA-methyltransferase (adenine-specific)